MDIGKGRKVSLFFVILLNSLFVGGGGRIGGEPALFRDGLFEKLLAQYDVSVAVLKMAYLEEVEIKSVEKC